MTKVNVLSILCGLSFLGTSLLSSYLPYPKRFRKASLYAFDHLPQEIKCHIFVMVMGNRIAHAQKVLGTLSTVSKEIHNLVKNASARTNIPFALGRLFEYARHGQQRNVKQCIHYLLQKKYRIDQLVLSQDMHGFYLMDYLVKAEMKGVTLYLSKLYKDVKHAEKIPESSAEKESEKFYYYPCKKRRYSIIEAVRKCDVSRVKELLNLGVHPDFGIGLSRINIPREYKQKKSKKRIKDLLKGWMPFERALVVACQQDCPEIISLLINYGANPVSSTVLNYVFIKKNHSVITTLISNLKVSTTKFRDFEKLPPSCNTLNPFEDALVHNDFYDKQILDQMICKGIINVHKLLIPAISSGSSRHLISFLLKKGVRINQHAYGTTPLIEAVKNGWVLFVTKFISMGVQVNAIDELGYTALSHARYKKNAEIINILIESGADRDCKKIPERYNKWLGLEDIYEE